MVLRLVLRPRPVLRTTQMVTVIGNCLNFTTATVFGTFSQKYRGNGTVNGTVFLLKIKISLK